jgi:hypothetical protein
MNRENLQKLADGLRQPLKSKFDMWTFGGREIIPGGLSHTCGSAGCAIGNATYIVEPKLIAEGWEQYSDRLFDLEEQSSEWEWCFSGSWGRTDNTPEGAADRIEVLINCGVPENWRAQLNGFARLCYKQEKKDES